jgi:hypothetical protein
VIKTNILSHSLCHTTTYKVTEHFFFSFSLSVEKSLEGEGEDLLSSDYFEEGKSIEK